MLSPCRGEMEMAENRVYLDEEGILRIVCIGDQDETSARAMVEERLRIAKTVSGPPRVLLDTTKAGRFSVEARQLAAQSLNMAKESRAAVIASSMPMRALGLFIAGERGAQNVRVFGTEREALSWLREPVKRSRRRGIAFYSLLMAPFRMRWLRIKERWLKEMFDVLGGVAMGDFSKRIAVSRHQDELTLIEAGINLMADDLEDREREAKEYERRLEEYSQGLELKVEERTQELLRRNRELAALNAIAAVASQSLDLHEVLNATLDKILEVMAAQGGTIYLLDEKGEELVLAAHRGLSDETLRYARRITVDANALGQATSGQMASGDALSDYAPYHTAIAASLAKEPLPLASVALRAKGKWLGLLHVLTGHELSAEEKQLLLSIANQMAVSIENASLYKNVRKLALIEERTRLARELHDSVSQLLFSVVLNSEAASATVKSNPELAKSCIHSVQTSAHEAREQMRNLLIELRLDELAEGLSAALATYVAKFQEREGIEVTFSVEGERPVSGFIERELFRIAQEALNNIAKHSRANSALMKLRFYPDRLRLKVEDDGIGFDLAKLGGTGLGLTTMKERAEGIKGRLEVESAPGKGTRVTVEVPLEEGHG